MGGHDENRLFNFTSHAGKALRNSANWMLKIVGDNNDEDEIAGGSTHEYTDGESLSASDEVVPWDFTWSEELMLGIRKSTNTGDDTREMSLPIDIPPDADQADLVTARWRDGTKHTFEEVTYGALQGAKKRAPSVAYWKATHSVTNNSLSLRQRTDRVQLLCLYDQNVVILQIALYKFGELPEPQPNHVHADSPALKEAIEFMTPFCKQWQLDEVKDRQALKAKKERAEKDRNLPRSIPKYAAKRPAAAGQCGNVVKKRPSAANVETTDHEDDAPTPPESPDSGTPLNFEDNVEMPPVSFEEEVLHALRTLGSN